MERWELKVKLDSPSMLNRHQEVEVTSVNWQDQYRARVLVSYRWHGIVYVTDFSQFLSFTSPSVRCWDIKKKTALQHWPMDEWYVQRTPVRPTDMVVYYILITVELFLYLWTASLQPHSGR